MAMSVSVVTMNGRIVQETRNGVTKNVLSDSLGNVIVESECCRGAQAAVFLLDFIGITAYRRSAYPPGYLKKIRACAKCNRRQHGKQDGICKCTVSLG